MSADGVGTTLTFADAFVLNWTRISAFGIEGGETIDTANLSSTGWRPKALRTLKGCTDIEAVGHLDPTKFIAAPINVNQLVTITYNDGSKHEVYGWLRTVTPSELSEGTKPEYTVSISISNVHSDSGEETGPAYTDPPSE